MSTARISIVGLLVLFFLLNNCHNAKSTETATAVSPRIYAKNVSQWQQFKCEFAPRLMPGRRDHIESCCENVYKNFSRYWASGGLYLSRLLETLQGWNCSQFKIECREQTFAFNNFTKLMYDRFCNHTQLVDKCITEVQVVLKSPSDSWKELTNQLNISSVSLEHASQPCVQVAFYERDAGGYGHYHEVIQPFLPFCPFIWCGFDESFVDKGKASVWNCMPHRCRLNIAILMAVSLILAIIVVVVNAIVLCVLCSHRKMRTSQGIYKISLALADILVGFVIFPTFVSSLYKYQLVGHNKGDLVNVTGYVADGRILEPGRIETVQIHKTSGHFRSQFSKSYLNFVGFVTILSLTVSVLTLVAAGIDRFFAVYRPTKYKQIVATPIAFGVTCFLWFLCLVFSILPLFLQALSYTLVASILVSSAGPMVLILYAFAFIIPLFFMWLVTLATYMATRSYKNRWKRLSTSDDRKTQGINETRLSRTLGIMVGVFTLSILPTVVVLVCGMLLRNIYPNLPRELSQSATVAFTSAEVVVIFILMCNSIWNCFIYSIRDREFRRTSVGFFVQLSRRIRCISSRDIHVQTEGINNPNLSEEIEHDEAYLDRTVFTEIDIKPETYGTATDTTRM